MNRTLEALADPMALMLALTAIIQIALGETRDGVILLVALVPVLGVDVVLEARSRRALAALAAAVAPRARVVRDGVEVEVPRGELVTGDVLVIREGDLLAADGVIREGTNVSIDESPLTGEADPVPKAVGDPFFAGSAVLGGHALGEVTGTGAATEIGRITELVATAGGGPTPLQGKIARVVRTLGFVAAGVALLVFAAAWLEGQGLRAAFLGAVSLAMAAIPEEFPLVFTLFLSLGAWRLARRGVLARRLVAVETLGSTTVICTDKTGTLTLGELSLEDHLGLAPGAGDAEVLELAALACELVADDPLERAIRGHCASHGVDVAAVHAGHELVVDYPFEPAGKHMTHVWRARQGGWRVAVKGAPEGVLEHCALGLEARAAAVAAAERLAARGTRVLAVAGRRLAAAPSGVRADDERDLELVGLLGFRDPLRPEASTAIASCRAAGIAVKLVTGDHALTAHAVAIAVGIPTGDVVTGDELAALPEAERARRTRAASILARMRPEQKLDAVAALVDAGEVVAMTGDGINDAPALRRATIGVSMGVRATQVARAAADLVLLHDDLGALVDTVREGRTIYANLQRAFLFLVAFHVPIIGLAVAAPLLGLPLLLLPVHLVWLELVVHPLSALVFEGEPAPGDVMRAPPRDARTPLLARPLVTRAVASGALLTLGALLLYRLRLGQGVAVARAAALSVLILGSVALVWAERALDLPWREVPWPRRPRFWIVCGLVLLSLPVFLGVPTLARALAVAPPAAADLGLAALLALASVAWRPLLSPGHGRSP